MKALAIYLVLLVNLCAKAQMTIDTTISIETLVDKIIVGKGIRVGNIKSNANKKALGYYTCPTNKIGIKSGLLLSTGFATDAIGPNFSPAITGFLNPKNKKWKGDKDLKKLAKGIKAYDISTIEFDFIPLHNKVSFEYSFGSEEFKEYVGSRYNDVFGFFVSGPKMKKKNVALLPHDKKCVAINNVNHKVNKHLFINNDPFVNTTIFKNIPVKPKIHWWQKIANRFFNKKVEQNNVDIYYTKKFKNSYIDETVSATFQYDGFTKKLFVEFYAIPYQKYHIKITIGDVGDEAFDSGVFIEEQSFTSYKDSLQPKFKPYLDKSNYFNFDSLFNLGNISPSEEKENFEDFEKTIVYFEVNSYEIADTSKFKLDQLAKMLIENKEYSLSLTGFTDNTGNHKKNQQLSEKRALALMYYLTLKGVERKRLSYLGKSSEDPIGDNKTTQGRALNRRVEIDLYEE